MQFLSENLEKRGDDLYYAGAEFTGIVFELKADGRMAADSIIHGKSIGKSRVFGEDVELYHSSSIQTDNGIFSFDGSVLDGFVLTFGPNGMLREEIKCESGNQVSQKKWSESGNLIEHVERGIARTWFENSHEKSIENSRYKVCFSDQGGLEYLEIKSEDWNQIAFEVPLTVSSSCTLKGKIPDGLLCLLVGFEKLTSLTLIDTEITDLGIEAFGICESLNQLTIRQKSHFDIESLRALLPSCQLHMK